MIIILSIFSDIGNFGGETSLDKVKISMAKTGVGLKGEYIHTYIYIN